jgi:hypothetical protein
MAKSNQLLDTLPAPTALSASVALVGLVTTASLVHLLRLTLTQTPTSSAPNTKTANTSHQPKAPKPVSASSVSYRTKIVSHPSYYQRSISLDFGVIGSRRSKR